MKKIIVFFIVSIITSVTYSQNVIKFHGKIMSKSGFVYNVNVINKKLSSGTTSDFEGNFAMPVKLNDTIMFSCIGYKKFQYIIPDTIKSNDYRVIISLIQDTIMLTEATVTPWPLNRTALKQAFLEESKKEKVAIANYAGFREIDGPQREPKPTFMNPISLLANLFSKKRIQQKKMDKFRRMLEEE